MKKYLVLPLALASFTAFGEPNSPIEKTLKNEIKNMPLHEVLNELDLVSLKLLSLAKLSYTANKSISAECDCIYTLVETKRPDSWDQKSLEKFKRQQLTDLMVCISKYQNQTKK